MIIREMKRMREDIIVLLENSDEGSWQQYFLIDALTAIDANIDQIMAEMRILETSSGGREFH